MAERSIGRLTPMGPNSGLNGPRLPWSIGKNLSQIMVKTPHMKLDSSVVQVHCSSIARM